MEAGDEGGAVSGQEGFGVEPEAGEELRAEDAFRVGFQRAVGAVVEDAPLHPWEECFHGDVFTDTSALVEGEFGAEVNFAARFSDLDGKFGGTDELALLLFGLSTEFRKQ